MKKSVLFFLFITSINKIFCQEFKWQNISVDVKSSFRALSVVDDKVAWIGGSKGWIGRSINGGKTWSFRQVKNYEEADFRSVYAFDSLTAIIANAGSPAHIFRTTDGGKNWQSVYQNEKKEAFIDGIDFLDGKKGMAYGDPIDKKLLLIGTRDSGVTWRESPDDQRPELKDGEASFAASGTGIRCFDKKKIAITTGGKISRLWISRDEGATWSVFEPPVTQEIESAGAFSSVFWNKKGVIVGGDYKDDTKIRTPCLYYIRWSENLEPSYQANPWITRVC